MLTHVGAATVLVLLIGRSGGSAQPTNPSAAAPGGGDGSAGSGGAPAATDAKNGAAGPGDPGTQLPPMAQRANRKFKGGHLFFFDCPAKLGEISLKLTGATKTSDMPRCGDAAARDALMVTPQVRPVALCSRSRRGNQGILGDDNES